MVDKHFHFHVKVNSKKEHGVKIHPFNWAQIYFMHHDRVSSNSINIHKSDFIMNFYQIKIQQLNNNLFRSIENLRSQFLLKDNLKS